MTAPAVVFDAAAFQTRYPEFKELSPLQLSLYFSEACMYCANNAANPAFAAGLLPVLLNMLTAHVAWLNAPRLNGKPSQAGGPASPLVGHITSASEGSVSVSVSNDYPPGSAQWYAQTTYGAAYWAATAQFRTVRYVGSPRRRVGYGCGFRGGLS